MNIQKKISSKKGVTLIELMIYMVLSVIIMTMVIEFSKNSTIMSVKNLKRMAAIKSVSNITNYVSEDLRRLGYKTDTTNAKIAGVYIKADDPNADSSSFNFTNVDTLDVLEFKYFNSETYKIDSIRYSVVDQELRRQLWTSELATPTAMVDQGSTVMAEGVTKFDLQFGSDLASGDDGEIVNIAHPVFAVVSPLTSVTNTGTDEATVLSGFDPDVATPYEADLDVSSTPIEIHKGQSYVLKYDFKPDAIISGDFDSEDHHLSFLFLDAGGSAIENLEEYTFYAGPFEKFYTREIMFSPGADAELNLRLRARLPNGSISIKNIIVEKLDEGKFLYAADIPTSNPLVFKKRVNSLKALIRVQKLTIGGNNLPIEEAIEKIIPLKNNGI